MIDAMPWHLRTVLSLPLGSIKKKREELTGPAEGTIPFAQLLSNEPKRADVRVTQDDIAFILYTSGTTGAPKGAPLTHGNINANVAAGLEWFGNFGEQDERIFAVLPLFHVYGLTLNFAIGFAVGAQSLSLIHI